MSPRQRQEGSAVATLDPTAIAEKVSQLEQEKRLATVSADIARWREIVGRVAAGKEPNGVELADIGAICRRLRLPPDALAVGVEALQQDKRLADNLQQTRDSMARTRARRDEIFPRIAELEKELVSLRQELHTYHGLAAGLPPLLGSQNEHRAKFGLLFGPLEQVAQSVISATSSATVGQVATTTHSWE